MASKNNQLAHACALALLGAGVQSVAEAQSAAPQAGAPTPSEQVQAAETVAEASAVQTSAVTVALIEELVSEGVISLERAQVLLENAEREAAMARQRQSATPTVRVPYVPETVRKEIRDELRAEIVEQAKQERWGTPGALPEWLDRIGWGGDFRLRYQGDFFDSGNFPYFPDVQAINDAGGVVTADGFPFLNSIEDRSRLRYRARLNVDAQVADRVKVGIGLASGDDNGPISTNRTFGDYFAKDAVWIDLAHIEIKPFDWLTFDGGRIANPFFSTNLVWDQDLRFEGASLRGAQTFGDAASGPSVFATVGAFPLRERVIESDSWLYAGQIGGALKFGPVGLKLAGAYYDYSHVQSRRNPPDGSRLNDYSRPLLLGQGNSVFNMRTDGLTTLAGLASEFQLVNVTAGLDYRFGSSKALSLTADYVRNRAMDKAAIAALRGEEGVPPGDAGWQVELSVGETKIARRHDWSAALAYKRLETDAVLAAFTDSDFGALGGTDLKGFVFQGRYGVTDGTWLTVTWQSADSISRPPFSTDVVMLDINARF